MWIRKKEIARLSDDIRKIIDGKDIDLRDNREGAWSILRNDIHTLANLKNEQLDTLSRERDVMADNIANISHQIKTPLTSMLIMADLLEGAFLEGSVSSAKQTEFLSNIKIGIARLEWLAGALLKVAKLDAGAVAFAKEKIKASELVDEAYEPLRILFDIKNQSLEISCETIVLCDRRWTVEALSNVLKNASEYSPDGGAIRVESGANPICSWVSVTDSGKGIAQNEIAGIFKRFEGSRSEKGYGIGLALAKAIMLGQNGDIEVAGGKESAGGNKSTGGKEVCGQGATFTLKFYK